MQKKVFIPKDNLYLALLIFCIERNPIFILIPSLEWIKKEYNFLVDRPYEGRVSKPEYGINFSSKSIPKIKKSFNFLKRVEELRK